MSVVRPTASKQPCNYDYNDEDCEPSSEDDDGGGKNKKKNNDGAVIGGVLGTLFAVMAVAAVALYYRRNHQKVEYETIPMKA